MEKLLQIFAVASVFEKCKLLFLNYIKKMYYEVGQPPYPSGAITNEAGFVHGLNTAHLWGTHWAIFLFPAICHHYKAIRCSWPRATPWAWRVLPFPRHSQFLQVPRTKRVMTLINWWRNNSDERWSVLSQAWPDPVAGCCYHHSASMTSLVPSSLSRR